MEIDVSNLQVVHNEAENRFETWIEGELSKLEYQEDGSSMVILHVGVHPEFRGQGVAGRLMQVSLAYARQRSLRVIPMCSYAAAYIRRNPQYSDLTRLHTDE